MFTYSIINAEAMEAAATLEGTLPQDRMLTVTNARETLVQMLERLNQAADTGWAAYPVVPIDGVTKPAVRRIENPATGDSANYVEWSLGEYESWQAAWKTLSDAMGLFASNFALGDPTDMQYSVGTTYVEPFKTAPTIARGAAGTVEFLVKLQRAFSNLPEHPRIKGAIDKATGKKGYNVWTIVFGLVAAAAVGGALIWARKNQKWPFVSHEEPSHALVPHDAEAATLMWAAVSPAWRRR
jgi:hypothetical protein